MPVSSTPVDPATNHIQGLGAIYDAAGNMVSDGLNNYVFDANNKLTSSSAIPGLGGSPVTFAYDSAGKLVNKNGTYYIYAGGRVIAEYALGAAANAPSAEYINLGHRQVATIVSGVTTFNFGDHLSTRVTADSSGNPVNTYGHFPYGQTIYQTGPARDFLFTSYRRDANTGLDNAEARFYSPRLSRFMSRDPLLGDNGYDYVDDDPINKIDPTGNDGECTTNPFDSRPLPLCGPDQLGGGSGTSASCGISFDDGGFSLTFTSNCSAFTVNFQGPSNPFGDIQGTLTDLLRIVFNPDTCPGGTFECPDNGSPIFGQPSCGSWCVSDYEVLKGACDPNNDYKFGKTQAQCNPQGDGKPFDWDAFFMKLACWAGVDPDNMAPINPGEKPDPKDSTDVPEKGTPAGQKRLPGQHGPRNSTPGDVNDRIGYIASVLECLNNVDEVLKQRDERKNKK
jgi:RHS repeat-associated protein